MTKVMCIQCSMEFPSDTIYLKHKKSGHTQFFDQATPLETPPVPTPPPGIPKEAMPSPEFIAQVNRIETGKEEAKIKPSQHPSELPPSLPLKLTYKYIGECPEHRIPIDTLELDVAKEHFCIAFCPVGKHQIENKQVARL